MNPWTASFEDYRQNILGEAKKKSDKKSSERWQDDDGDGKWYEKSDVDGKISDREKKEKKKNVKENKDCCKKCGSYKHTTKECTIKEGIEDIIARLEKKRIRQGGDPDKSPLGKKTGRAMKAQQDKGRKKKVKKESVEVNHIDGSTTQIIDVVRAPAMVAAPKFSNWKEEMYWDEALKPEPLKIKETGVKNKIQINPEVKTEGVLSDVGKKKKKESKKHEYPAGASGGDAGAKAKKKMKNKEKHKYVNDIRDFDEDITLTRGDYGSRNVKNSAWSTAKSKGFKGYKAGGGLTPQFKLADSYEIDEKKKLANTSPLIDRVSNWSKTKIKESSIQQAATALATKSIESKKKAVGALTKTTEEVVDEGLGSAIQSGLEKVDSAVTKAANTKVGKPIANTLKKVFGPWKSGDGGSNRKSATKATHGKTWEHHKRDADGKEIPHNELEGELIDEKKKGLDGKKCWDGYKLAGTKKKGGKTVDNCVKVKEGKRWQDDDGDGKWYEKSDVDGKISKREKKAKKHDCASKVKHEEFGIGNPIKGMHDLDESGNVAHYDVFFEHGIEKNVPVSSLEILEGHMHEHVIGEGKGEKNCGCGQDPCITYGKNKNAHKMPDGTVMPGKTHKKEEVSLDEKKIKWSVKGGKKDEKDMSKEVGKAKVDYRMLAQSYTPDITVNGTALDERLGGKGYSKKATKGGGDWPDSDRGEGNKAKRRSGGKVVAKSPTYLAHVKNKKKVKSEEVEQIDEKNKYAKVTGKNLKHNKVQPKGGTAKGDSAFKYVVAQIKKKHGRAALLGGEGQNKKKKGEKGRQQPGDRKGTPADTIARRRQSKADADAAMRDTRGT